MCIIGDLFLKWKYISTIYDAHLTKRSFTPVKRPTRASIVESRSVMGVSIPTILYVR